MMLFHLHSEQGVPIQLNLSGNLPVEVCSHGGF